METRRADEKEATTRRMKEKKGHDKTWKGD
jgi:hypothetical protein